MVNQQEQGKAFIAGQLFIQRLLDLLKTLNPNMCPSDSSVLRGTEELGRGYKYAFRRMPVLNLRHSLRTFRKILHAQWGIAESLADRGEMPSGIAITPPERETRLMRLRGEVTYESDMLVEMLLEWLWNADSSPLNGGKVLARDRSAIISEVEFLAERIARILAKCDA